VALPQRLAPTRYSTRSVHNRHHACGQVLEFRATKSLRVRRCFRLSTPARSSSTRDAARTVNLALDYVSRLARQGAITGRRISRIWFIDLAEISGEPVNHDPSETLR
jgi:hypothetical protein